MRRHALLLLIPALAAPAWWLLAQGNAADTARLDPVLTLPSDKGNSALDDAMETVGSTVTTAKTEGVDKTLEHLQNTAQKAADLNRQGAKQASGFTKGADARAWQANQAGRANTIRKIRLVGDLIEIVDSFSSAAGYLAEGDTTGAAAVFINALGKKGASAIGAAGGSIAGPGGTIVGAEGGGRLYDAYVAGKVTKAADDKFVQDRKDAMLGAPRTGRYSGMVTWVATPQYDAASGAPPMSFRFQGPMTADLDREGNLTIHYELKGAMEGLGLAGATAGIGLNMTMSTSGDLKGKATGASWSANGHGTGLGTFTVDYRGAAGAPANQSQTSRGSAEVEASGTLTNETLTGSLTSKGMRAKPITFSLTKQR